jgi:hypothetical protein
VTKVVKSATMGALLRDLTTIFQIKSYLQRAIYVWNKMSKHIISQCEMDFQTILLYIAYDSQHFEAIEYAIGMARFLLAFETMISRL